jgi:hypothetical protein
VRACARERCLVGVDNIRLVVCGCRYVSADCGSTGVLFLTDASERVCTVFAMREGGKMGIEVPLSRPLSLSFTPPPSCHSLTCMRLV